MLLLKKILVFFLIIMVLFIFGCGDKDINVIITESLYKNVSKIRKDFPNINIRIFSIHSIFNFVSVRNPNPPDIFVGLKYWKQDLKRLNYKYIPLYWEYPKLFYKKEKKPLRDISDLFLSNNNLYIDYNNFFNIYPFIHANTMENIIENLKTFISLLMILKDKNKIEPINNDITKTRPDYIIAISLPDNIKVFYKDTALPMFTNKKAVTLTLEYGLFYKDTRDSDTILSFISVLKSNLKSTKPVNCIEYSRVKDLKGYIECIPYYVLEKNKHFNKAISICKTRYRGL